MSANGCRRSRRYFEDFGNHAQGRAAYLDKVLKIQQNSIKDIAAGSPNEDNGCTQLCREIAHMA